VLQTGVLRRLVVLALLLGAVSCRGVLGIDTLPGLSDAAPSDAEDDAGGDVVVQTFCDGVLPPPEGCSDFDRGSLTVGWDNDGQSEDPGAQGGGTLALDPSFGFGDTASALLTTPALSTTASRASAILMKTLPRPVRRVFLSFEAYVATEDYQTGGFAIVASVFFGNGDGGVLLVRDGLGVGFSTGPGSATFRLDSTAPHFPAGHWTLVTLGILNEPQDGGPDGIVSIQIESETAGRATFPAKFQSSGAPRVLVGPSVGGPLGAFKMNVDNVVLRYVER
jgi:hypothetical protein